jgi:hypothetical protein
MHQKSFQTQVGSTSVPMPAAHTYAVPYQIQVPPMRQRITYSRVMPIPSSNRHRPHIQDAPTQNVVLARAHTYTRTCTCTHVHIHTPHIPRHTCYLL